MSNKHSQTPNTIQAAEGTKRSFAKIGEFGMRVLHGSDSFLWWA